MAERRAGGESGSDRAGRGARADKAQSQRDKRVEWTEKEGTDRPTFL